MAMVLDYQITVEPVLKVCPIGLTNTVSQDRGSLVTGSVILNIEASARNHHDHGNLGSFKTGVTPCNSDSVRSLGLTPGKVKQTTPSHEASLGPARLPAATVSMLACMVRLPCQGK